MSGGASVFISYSRYDRHAAFAIKRLLEENSVQVWLDVISIKVSSQLLQELYDNIDRHQTFCLLLSPTSVASPWCLKEIEHAKSRDGLRFVPVILRSCKIPTDLDNIVALDAREGLAHDSVRSRLLRALCGDGIVEDSIVFTQLQQDLLANSQFIEDGESQLLEVKKKITTISNEPIRRIDLHVEVESLPDDGNVLELRLKLDLWKVALSIFVARYREDHTWPSELGFEECEYTKFYKKKYAPVDVRFRWMDYLQKMDRTVTTNENLGEFYMKFDGHEFYPGGELRMPAKFEVPSLIEQARDWSAFELILHSTAAPNPTLIDKETDIQIELFGEVCDRSIRLYRSNHTYNQETLFRCPSIIAETNTIWKEALVHGCDSNDTLSNVASLSKILRPETLTALDDLDTDWEQFVFTSVEERRTVAHALCSRGSVAHIVHSQYRDAFWRFIAASHLFRSLFTLGTLTMWDVLTEMDCAHMMIETCLNQQRPNVAVNIAANLKDQLATLVQAHSQVADYLRLYADTCLLNAEIMSQLQVNEKAMQELDATAKVYQALYTAQPSQSRRFAHVEALQQSIHCAQLWGLGSSPLVQAWTIAVEKEVGAEIASKLLTFKDPTTLPVWLIPTTLSAWPTGPVHNDTLRYALHLPKRWIQQPLVRGTATQVEHVYWGNASQEAEWLCIDFMGNIQQGYHSNHWVDSVMALSGLPVVFIHDDTSRGPKKRTWDYLGSIAALAKKLQADEAYGWTGIFQYQRDYIMLGRMYAIVVRRGSFGWKIVLSFNTAVLEGMPESILESNDHVRAGAILGDLRLDGIPEGPPVNLAAGEMTSGDDTHVKNAEAIEPSTIVEPRRVVKQSEQRSVIPRGGFSSLRSGILPTFQLSFIYGDHDPVD